MKEWIEKMNEMFEANRYTNDKRVTVDYCETNISFTTSRTTEMQNHTSFCPLSGL